MKTIQNYYKSAISLVVVLILSLIPGSNTEKISTMNIVHLDKVAHFIMYFSLSIILIFDLLKNTKLNKKSIFVTVIIFIILFGGLIEIMQDNFIERRSANIFDFIANIIGCVTAVLLVKNPVIFSILHRKL